MPSMRRPECSEQFAACALQLPRRWGVCAEETDGASGQTGNQGDSGCRFPCVSAEESHCGGDSKVVPVRGYRRVEVSVRISGKCARTPMVPDAAAPPCSMCECGGYTPLQRRSVMKVGVLGSGDVAKTIGGRISEAWPRGKGGKRDGRQAGGLGLRRIQAAQSAALPTRRSLANWLCWR